MIKPEYHFMQTPKEKANKLCMTFLMETDIPTKFIAKQCAKLHIRLTLENETIKPSNNLVIEYYQEVLNEIEKQ
jgi:hypothetical protein